MKAFLLLILCLPAMAEAKLSVVTTTTDLQALVETVGKEKVDVSSIAKGTQDPHQIEAKPSFMVKIRSADLVLAQGLELESAWIIPLIQGARNPKVNAGSKGFYELGEHLDPIEVAKGNVTRAEGDVHPGGNPHFQLDPIRMGQAAALIADKMGELDGANKDFYKANATAFVKLLEEKTKEWKTRLAKTEIKEVVAYHKTFSYFFHRFDIKNTLELEPKPGIPPTASHLLDVIAQMKARNLKLVLVENFYEAGPGDKIKAAVPGVTVSQIPVSVGGEPNIKSVFDLIENLVRVFESAKK